MSEEKKATGFYDATKENKETHPVQGMVWGIVSLVISAVALLILFPQPILLAVYSGMRASGKVAAADLATTNQVFLILTIVYGCVSFLFALGTLIIHGNIKGVIKEAMPDGRARAGLITSKIAWVFALIAIVLSVVSTVLFALFLVLK